MASRLLVLRHFRLFLLDLAEFLAYLFEDCRVKVLVVDLGVCGRVVHASES